MINGIGPFATCETVFADASHLVLEIFDTVSQAGKYILLLKYADL